MAAEPLHLYAAGSLKAALTEAAEAYTRTYGSPVALTFGPSGLLRERLQRDEQADVFASANLEHAQALARKAPMVLFARNRLCGLARPEIAVTPDTLLDTMLDPKIKLGTSTPKADPSGDYAWELFRKAEAIRPSSYQRLTRKALTLTGGPNAAPRMPGRPGLSVYAAILNNGQADLFLTYCTNAAQAAKEVRGLKIVAVPEALSVGADYGLTPLTERGQKLALFILSPGGQEILARHGFTAPTLPVQGAL